MHPHLTTTPLPSTTSTKLEMMCVSVYGHEYHVSHLVTQQPMIHHIPCFFNFHLILGFLSVRVRGVFYICPIGIFETFCNLWWCCMKIVWLLSCPKKAECFFECLYVTLHWGFCRCSLPKRRVNQVLIPAVDHSNHFNTHEQFKQGKMTFILLEVTFLMLFLLFLHFDFDTEHPKLSCIASETSWF